jgi:hypothetical protein
MIRKLAGCVFGLVFVFAAGCGQSDEATGEGAGSALSSGQCTEQSTTPCTPAVGTPLRSSIADLLRFSISGDLSKNGVAPGDNDVKFVFKTLLIENAHIYAAATIMRGDGTTPFDMTGTKFAGKPNTVQSLMEVESGSEFTHQIGIGLDTKKFACAFVEARFDGEAPGMYPGDMRADCAANPLPKAGMPSTVGQCSDSTITKVDHRLVGVPGSGSEVEFQNGGFQVGFDELPEVTESRPGDPVTICLVELPTDCPPGDDRGKIYKTTNERTGKSWTMADSSHMCGGA